MNDEERMMRLEMKVESLERNEGHKNDLLEKMDERLRSVEKSVWIGFGGIAAIEILVQLIHH